MTAPDTRFDDIRPYRDDEVRAVLAQVLADDELYSALTGFLLGQQPAWLKKLATPIIRWKLKHDTRHMNSVRDFQQLVERYMLRMIESTTSRLSVSGLENLQHDQAYLFVSNHRDIAMDPAFVNWVLWHAGFDTVRIAIGDNLLTKPFASHLMRLNKSFLVKRGETAPKKIFAALKQLSYYIYHSVVEAKQHVWIAQREGRAKDGRDLTEEAIIKMFAMSKPKEQSLSDFIGALNIVPVAISYEWDPCDVMKARELYTKETEGSYQKDTHEDVQSIGMGIAGEKGRVHLHFGQPLSGEFADTEAVAREIDRQILSGYTLFPSNFLAVRELGESVAGDCGYPPKPWPAAETEAARVKFAERLANCPEAFRPHWLAMYANPVRAKRAQAQPQG